MTVVPWQWSIGDCGPMAMEVASMVSNKKCRVGGVVGVVRGDGVGRGDVMGGGIMFEGGANRVGFR